MSRHDWTARDVTWLDVMGEEAPIIILTQALRDGSDIIHEFQLCGTTFSSCLLNHYFSKYCSFEKAKKKRGMADPMGSSQMPFFMGCFQHVLAIQMSSQILEIQVPLFLFWSESLGILLGETSEGEIGSLQRTTVFKNIYEFCPEHHVWTRLHRNFQCLHVGPTNVCIK